MSDGRLTSASIEVPDAFQAIETYYECGWTDGLPIVPPTANAVNAFLEAANLQPGQILGVEPVKGAVITAEKAAINAVMAGCRPEYMPVIVAAVEAITTDQFSLHSISVSTMGAGILLIVNGPVAEELGIHSGVSAFGPGHRANATIGRAIRLIVMNVVGTRPGELDKATIGHPGKYSWCIAENVKRSPWEPLYVSRGVSPDDSAVTVFAGLSGLQVGEHEANTPEGVLDAFAERLPVFGKGIRETLVVLCPEHTAFFKSAGWSRKQAAEYLYKATQPGTLASPDATVFVTAGGDGGAWSMVVPMWSNGAKTKSVTKRIMPVSGT